MIKAYFNLGIEPVSSVSVVANKLFFVIYYTLFPIDRDVQQFGIPQSICFFSAEEVNLKSLMWNRCIIGIQNFLVSRVHTHTLNIFKPTSRKRT